MFSNNRFYNFTMMFFVSLLLFLCGPTNGQTLGIFSDLTFPSGDFADGANTGYAAGIVLEKGIGPVNATLSGSYLNFGNVTTAADSFESEVAVQSFPTLQAGAKYYLGSFYVGAAAGVQFMKATVTNSVNGETIQEESATENKFVLTPAVGLQFPVYSFTADASLYYSLVSDYNYFGARVTLFLF